MRAIAIAPLLVSLACAGPRAALDPQHAPNPVSLCEGGTACGDTVAITYLGVDGFLVRRGASSVLTPPLFTRRSLFATIANLTYRSDTALVDRIVGQLGVRFSDVSFVLAGHSHYDHILDVPYLARAYLPRDARIVGGPSAKHILAADAAAAARSVAISADDAGTATHVGRWIYAADGRSRVMALASSHAANFLFITFAWGSVKKDRTSLPRSAWGWKTGEVYAFVVDFIARDSTPEFRFVFQDAVSRPEFNTLPPFEERDRHVVNVAIVCAGNFDKAPGYPTVLLENIHPQRVIVGHWDDFFDEWEREPEVVAMTATKKLRRRLNAAAPGRWSAMYPGAELRLAFSAQGARSEVREARSREK